MDSKDNGARRGIRIFFILCVVTFSCILLLKRNEGVQEKAEREDRAAENPSSPVSLSSDPTPALTEQMVVKHAVATPDPIRKRMIPEITSLTKDLNSPDISVHEDLDIIDSVLDYYRRVYHENPMAGLNEEVVEALTGGNRMGLVFIPPDHSAISEKGELLDRWGTPYFFHALSATDVEILSAGPDGIFWNHDDVEK